MTQYNSSVERKGEGTTEAAPEVILTTPNHQREEAIPFWRGVWEDLQPIFHHAIIMLVIELALLAVGGMTWVLSHLLPKHEEVYDRIELVDLWAALAIATLFALYATIEFSFRLSARAWKTWKETWSR